MPGGALPRRDTELVILRVAANCACAYEQRHHEHLARRAGLSPAEIARVAEGPDAAGWSAREATLLRAADALHADRMIERRALGRAARGALATSSSSSSACSSATTRCSP